MRKWMVFALLLVAAPVRAQGDMIPVNQVTFVGPDASAWPITAALTRVTFTGAGTGLTFTKGGLPVTRGGDGWPDTCTPFETCKEPGLDMGALQYSMGVVLKVNGQWFASAPVESWYQRVNPGGAINDQTVVCPSGSGQLHCNWFYDPSRWPNLASAHPDPGEPIGVFVVAGDARNGYNPLRERSNIVLLNLPPTGAETVFDFPAFAAPSPTVVLQPVPSLPPTLPSTDTGAIFNQLAINHAAEMAELDALRAQLALARQDIADFRGDVKTAWEQMGGPFILKYVLPAVTAYLAGRKL